MPTDDPTDPQDTGERPTRKRVSGSQLLDAIEALPGRVAAAVGGSGGDDGGERDTGNLPPEVTFEAEPEPTPEEIAETEPPPAIPPADGSPAPRRGGFPRRRR